MADEIFPHDPFLHLHPPACGHGLEEVDRFMHHKDK
jgi:hypothetical protein